MNSDQTADREGPGRDSDDLADDELDGIVGGTSLELRGGMTSSSTDSKTSSTRGIPDGMRSSEGPSIG